MLAARRLPGIRVEVAPPPAAQALPRMDVAIFAGFAATGPLHVPVLITSVPHYAAVFGRDAPLAWDAQRGARVFAHLGPAVRGFFGNGGRRCWVIRVARSAALEAVRRALRPQAPLLPVAIANRFPVAGVLEVGATGEITAALAQARSEGSWSDELRLATALQERTVGVTGLAVSTTNDVCTFRARRRIDAGELVEFRDAALRSFAIVEHAAIDTVEVAAPYVVTARFCAFFERIDPAAMSPLAGEACGPGFDAPVAATLAADDGADRMQLTFTIAMPFAPRAEQWIRFEAGSESIWLRAQAVAQSPVAAASPAGGAVTHADVEVFGPAWRQLDTLPALAAVDRVFCSTLDLRAENRSNDELARLDAVGLSAAAKNPWWQQVHDEALFRAALETRADTLAGPEDQAAPLPFAPIPALTPPRAWLPLGVDALFSDGLGPLPNEAGALERDGLADFDSSLFLDPELAGLATDEVAARAEAIRFLRDQPRALFGIHAAHAIGSGGLFGECSLLCVPDAVHIGWQRGRADEPPPAQPAPAPLLEPDFGAFLDCMTRTIAAPVLSGPGLVASLQPYLLLWTASEPGAQYVLSEAQHAGFSDARTIFEGDLTQHAIDPPREGIYYYRVFARAGGQRSPDSNAIVVRVSKDQWQQLEPDEFAAHGESELLRLHRSMLRFAASSGELFTVLALPRHYRSPQAIRYAGRLRAVGAPGMLADADSFALVEARTLSYGALYHPWLVCGSRPPPNLAPRANAGDTRIVPPDGAITGTFAARASRRGAWVAPANESLLGAVALTPDIDPGDWLPLQEAAINLVRDDARGFITLSADTLSADPELKLINVRRLLTLLRRLALRRGTSYVFEPNGPALRRAVQRGFDVLLADLFHRGAFVGRTQDEAFRVVTDDTVNTRIDADAGRFIVELRVAPSLPMRFLSLLLAQSGERLTVTEEL